MFGQKKLIFPEKIRISDYQKVREYLIDKYKNLEGVVGIYDRGSITAPGISDLDLAVVFKNKIKDKEIGSKLAAIKIPEDFTEIINNSTLMVFCEAHFKRLTLLDDVKMTCYYGKPLKLDSFKKDKQELINICQILDWLPERILSLTKFTSSPIIKVRTLLGFLRSLGYTLKKVGDLGILNDQTLKSYSNSLESLRSNLFFLDKEEARSRILKFLESAFQIGYESLWTVNRFLIDNSYYPKCDSDDIGKFFIKDNFGFDFISKQETVSLIKVLENSVSGSKFLIKVPNLWAIHLKTYALAEGVISNKLTKAFTNFSKIPVMPDSDLKKVLIERMNLCNGMADFLYENNFKKGLYKFGWFY